MKRIFTLLFAAMLAGQAWAEDFQSGSLHYTTYLWDFDGNYEAVAFVVSENSANDYANNYSGLTTVTIPDTVESESGDKYAVLGINPSAFKNCRSLTSITLPDSLVEIYESAFEGCIGLKSIVIPNSVTRLDVSSFNGCTSLESVTLPDTITCITASTFGGCTSLKSIEIPNTVTFIGNSAFSGSGLTYLDIPNSVTDISGSAFENCAKLTTVIIPNTVTEVDYHAFKGCSNASFYCEAESKPTGWNNHWNPNGKATFWGYKPLHYEITSDSTAEVARSDGYSSLTEVAIPETVKIDGKTYTVTGIGDRAFYPCHDLTSVIIPNSVEYIDYGAFMSCNKLVSITIPESVTKLRSYVFNGCTSLTSVTFPNYITSIPYRCFGGCTNLSTVSLPNTLIDMDRDSFEGCNNLEYNIYDNALYLGNTENPYVVLIKTKTTDITACEINSNCKLIACEAFKDCSVLTSITVPNSVENINHGAFNGCSALQSMTLPFVGDKRHSFTDASQYPFGYIFGWKSYEGGIEISVWYYNEDNTCTIGSNFTIPSSLKSVTLTDCDYIQYNAFYDCNNLTSITIPTSVTQIESEAMPRGENLTIYCDLKAAPRGWSGNWNPSNRPVVWGNVDVVDANNIDAAGFAYRILDGTNAEIIDYVGSETEIVIPSTITQNGEEYTVTRIGDNAFNYYKDMVSLTIPNTVTSIGNRAFAYCHNLASVSIPNSVTTIGSCVFYNCYKLT